MSNLEALKKPIKVGDVTLKNRIVMPPMDTNYANKDGSFSRKHYRYLTQRAKGGAGLIIVEACSVSWPEGKISERQLDFGDPTVVADMHDLTDSVHAFGAKIIPQIHHGGFMAVPAYCKGIQSVCASDYAGAREMTKDEIKKVIADFVKAAQNAQAAGFDGVEIHCSHMYLLNQFMCPISNRRTDEYGGSLENRFRIVKEIITGIREACPPPFLLDVRLGIVDLVEGGTTLEEGVQYAKWCEECGADMLNISCGFYTSVSQSTESQWEEEGCRLYMSEAAKKAVNIPVAIVGKLRTPEFCAKIIDEGKTDMVAIGRQLICDPNWPNKVLTGKTDQIRPCLNCDDGCLGQFYFQHGNVHCTMNPYVGYEDLYCEDSVPATAISKNIIVIGGGVAGMQFAIISKKRGNNVIIFEKENYLGGQMVLAGVPPYKDDVNKGLKWFIDEVARQKIDVRLNTEIQAEDIMDMSPDAVVIATGSTPVIPPINGIENSVESWRILSKEVETPEDKKVTIIGGGVVGSELAHLLIENNCQVTIIEMLPEICKGHEALHKGKLEEYLGEHAEIKLNAKVLSVDEKTVNYIDQDGVEQRIEADIVITATGQQPVGQGLYDQLLNMGIEAYKIGDSMKASNIRFATRSALELAYMI